MMFETAGSLCNTYDNPYLQAFAGDHRLALNTVNDVQRFT